MVGTCLDHITLGSSLLVLAVMLRWQAWNVLRGRRRSQNPVCLVVDEFQGCWVSEIAQQEYGTFPPTTSVLFSVCVVIFECLFVGVLWEFGR